MKPRTAALDALVDTLSAEHEVVEYLLFKLTTLKLLFMADEGRALAESGLHTLRSLLDAVAHSTGAELYTERGTMHRTTAPAGVQLDRAL